MPSTTLSRNVLQGAQAVKAAIGSIRQQFSTALTSSGNAFRGRAGAAGLVLVLAAIVPAAAAGPAQLAPFKDDLFAYPPLTALSQGGDVVDVDYSERRDLDERDEVPERRVNGRYVDLSPLASQKEETLETPAGPLMVSFVGNAEAPTSIVLFIHGRNGDRRLGMNDRTFGGNFNRLKNLMSRSNGLYVTADAGTFSETDRIRIAVLIEALTSKRPHAPMVLACASMGGGLCWSVMRDPKAMAAIDGVVMLGSSTDTVSVGAMRKAAEGRAVPLVMAHGTRDTVFAWSDQKATFDALHGKADGPLRFISFEGGTHGTPIRMIDWRDTLNWIFARLP